MKRLIMYITLALVTVPLTQSMQRAPATPGHCITQLTKILNSYKPEHTRLRTLAHQWIRDLTLQTLTLAAQNNADALECAVENLQTIAGHPNCTSIITQTIQENLSRIQASISAPTTNTPAACTALIVHPDHDERVLALAAQTAAIGALSAARSPRASRSASPHSNGPGSDSNTDAAHADTSSNAAVPAAPGRSIFNPLRWFEL